MLRIIFFMDQRSFARLRICNTLILSKYQCLIEILRIIYTSLTFFYCIRMLEIYF